MKQLHRFLALLLLAAGLHTTAHSAIVDCIVGVDESATFGTGNFGTVNPLAANGPITTSFTYLAQCTRTASTDPRRVDLRLTLGGMSSTGGLSASFNYDDTLLTLTWGRNERTTKQVLATASFTLTGLTNTTTPGARTFTQNVSAQARTCEDTGTGDCTGYGAVRLETTILNVNVAKNCNIASGTVSFGSYRPSSTQDRDASGNTSVVCTNTTPYLVKFSGGNANSATVKNMRQTGISDLLNYQLYRDISRTVALQGNTGLSGTGTGASQVFPVYGRIPRGQFVTPGNYRDTLTMTVEY